MTPITCFLIEPTGIAYRWLRRYASGDCPSQADVKPEYRYHCAMTKIEDGDIVRAPDGKSIRVDPMEWPVDDPRWPVACGCGHRFEDVRDTRQLFYQEAYRAPDGRLFDIHCSELPGVIRAPAGAMWYADWMPFTAGPDGRCLVVRCPRNPDGSGVSDWLPDGPSTTHSAPAWTRAGVPPKVTAMPSIFVHAPDGFHGWLRDGVLVSC